MSVDFILEPCLCGTHLTWGPWDHLAALTSSGVSSLKGKDLFVLFLFADSPSGFPFGNSHSTKVFLCASNKWDCCSQEQQSRTLLTWTSVNSIGLIELMCLPLLKPLIPFSYYLLLPAFQWTKVYQVRPTPRAFQEHLKYFIQASLIPAVQLFGHKEEKRTWQQPNC